MPITQADVSAVLEEARAFYKGGDKSTNKVYLNPAKVHLNLPYGATNKYDDRNYNALDEHNDMSRLDAYIPKGADEGKWIVEGRERRGNCQRMAAVVRYYCERNPQLQAKGASLYTVEVIIPDVFSHVFVVACEPTMWMFHYPTVARMANMNPPAHGAWVIDCWLNLACPAPEYASRLRQKMDTWRAQSKVVINEQNKKVDNPDVLAQYIVINPARYTRHR